MVAGGEWAEVWHETGAQDEWRESKAQRQPSGDDDGSNEVDSSSGTRLLLRLYEGLGTPVGYTPRTFCLQQSVCFTTIRLDLVAFAVSAVQLHTPLEPTSYTALIVLTITYPQHTRFDQSDCRPKRSQHHGTTPETPPCHTGTLSRDQRLSLPKIAILEMDRVSENLLPSPHTYIRLGITLFKTPLFQRPTKRNDSWCDLMNGSQPGSTTSDWTNSDWN
ncbi:hypothetical protein DFH27DRAFT_605307 [Peziza echinospora]|nr:hypothetical protein DFH27DRAFT_605307 [Peziza echinospora]